MFEAEPIPYLDELHLWAFHLVSRTAMPGTIRTMPSV